LPLVVNVVGRGRSTGKTAIIEQITRKLTEKNLQVASIKHISTGTFDTPNKDTWRHLKAGAKCVVALTSGEIIRIEKKEKANLTQALEVIDEGVDIVLVEGFKDSAYPKIIVGEKSSDVNDLLPNLENVFAISGRVSSDQYERDKIVGDVPILKMEELLLLIEDMVIVETIKKLPGLNCKLCGYDSCIEMGKAIMRGAASIDDCKTIANTDVKIMIDDIRIYLSPFPRDFIKNVIIGMAKSLKGVEIDNVNVIEVRIDLHN
jgi:molybdopterin-guanine dinucleotide biosynthesis protein B